MIWETCHFYSIAIRPFLLGTLGERDAKNLRGFLCVLLVSLIEVTSSEQKHSVRMLAFQVEELCHYRRENNGCNGFGLGFGGFFLGFFLSALFFLLLWRVTTLLFLLFLFGLRLLFLLFLLFVFLFMDF